jgi:hypothetical protein
LNLDEMTRERRSRSFDKLPTTPYDAQFQPKLLREAIAGVLRATPARRPAVYLPSSP